MKYEIVMEEALDPKVIIRVSEGTPPDGFTNLPSGDGVVFESDKKYFIGPKTALPDYKEN